MKEKRGVALIIVLVLLFLFSIIILTVVLTTTSAYRRSAYFRDKLSAQNLAEIGIADALYKLNYRYHDLSHYYGFRTDGECWTDGNNPPQNNSPYSYTMRATDFGILLASVNDGVEVTLQINDGTYGDTLTATGHFRGRRVKVQTNIRTASIPSNLARTLDGLNQTTWDYYDTKGIPEAFNKHVIYAYSVSGNATNVKGNITATNASSLAPGSERTLTDTTVNVPVPGYPAIPQPEDLSGYTLPPYFPAGWVLFRPVGASANQARMSTDGGNTWVALPPGVTYGGGIFTFTTYTTPNKIYVMQSALNQQYGDVFINGATIQNEFYADGYITLMGNCNIQPANPSVPTFFKAGESGIHSGTQNITVASNAVFTGGDLILFHGSISGSSITIGDNVQITNGALVCDSSLTLPSNLVINAQNSTREAAILIYYSSTTANPVTLNINPATLPTITLGPNQRAAFMVLTQQGSGNSVTVNIGTTANVDFETTQIQNIDGKSAIIACAWDAVANINIGSASNWAKLRGLVYCRGNNKSSDGVTLNNAGTRIYGSIVTDGFVNLNNAPTLIYDGSLYRAGCLNNQTIDMYTGFVGGRRIFLPRNWKIIW